MERPPTQRSRGRGGDAERFNALSENIIGAAISVHRTLGPGLLESTYETCLAHELSTIVRVRVERQRLVPIVYRDLVVEDAYRLDLEVSDSHATVLVEVKAVEKIAPVHEMQLLTYLKLADRPLGLLINFNVPRLVDGIRRVVHEFPDQLSASPPRPLPLRVERGDAATRRSP